MQSVAEKAVAAGEMVRHEFRGWKSPAVTVTSYAIYTTEKTQLPPKTVVDARGGDRQARAKTFQRTSSIRTTKSATRVVKRTSTLKPKPTIVDTVAVLRLGDGKEDPGRNDAEEDEEDEEE